MDAGVDIAGALATEVASASFWLKEIDFRKSNLPEFKEHNSVELKRKYVYLKPTEKMNGDVIKTSPTPDRKSSPSSSSSSISTSSERPSSSPNKSDVHDEAMPEPRVSLFPPDDVDWTEDKTKKIGSGLQNFGNTCFMNSVLQCLSYCPPVFNYLQRHREESGGKCPNFCMQCLLSEQVTRCRNGSPDDALRPHAMVQRLRSVCKTFQPGRQEDAHEYLRHLIDLMARQTIHAYEEQSRLKLDVRSKETTAFNRIFGGYLRSQVTCLVCNHKSNTYDHFMDLMLDIKNVTTVKEAFSKFVKTEQLQNENAYKCPKCKKRCPATKNFKVHRPPNVCTIQFKRFEFSRFFGGKITKHIEIPLNFDMRPYMSEPGPSVMYYLNSVLIHWGNSCNSGHYYSFVKSHSEGFWYLMDDSRVQRVSPDHVRDQNAYIILYTRHGGSQSSQGSPQKKMSILSSTSVSTSDSSLSIGPKLPNGCFSGGGESISRVSPILKTNNSILVNNSTKNAPAMNGNHSILNSPLKESNQKHVSGVITTPVKNTGPKIITDKPLNPLIRSNKSSPGKKFPPLKFTTSTSTRSLPNPFWKKLEPGARVTSSLSVKGVGEARTETTLTPKTTTTGLVGYDDSSDSEEAPCSETPIMYKTLKGVGHLLNKIPRLSDPSSDVEDKQNGPLRKNNDTDDFRLFSSSEFYSSPVDKKTIGTVNAADGGGDTGSSDKTRAMDGKSGTLLKKSVSDEDSNRSLILRSELSKTLTSGIPSNSESGLSTLGKDVTTWEGDVNGIDQATMNKKRANPHDDEDDDYDAELDKGKIKKIKGKVKMEDVDKLDENPFDKVSISGATQASSVWNGQPFSFPGMKTYSRFKGFVRNPNRGSSRSGGRPGPPGHHPRNHYYHRNNNNSNRFHRPHHRDRK